MPYENILWRRTKKLTNGKNCQAKESVSQSSRDGAGRFSKIADMMMAVGNDGGLGRSLDLLFCWIVWRSTMTVETTLQRQKDRILRKFPVPRSWAIMIMYTPLLLYKRIDLASARKVNIREIGQFHFDLACASYIVVTSQTSFSNFTYLRILHCLHYCREVFVMLDSDDQPSLNHHFKGQKCTN